MRQGDTPKQGHPKAAACLWRAALPAPWVPARQPVFARPRLDLVTPSTCPGAPRSVRGAALSPAPILGVLLGGWGALGSPQGCGSMWDLFAPGAVAVGWRDLSHMKPPHWPLLWGSPPAPPPQGGSGFTCTPWQSWCRHAAPVPAEPRAVAWATVVSSLVPGSG